MASRIPPLLLLLVVAALGPARGDPPGRPPPPPPAPHPQVPVSQLRMLSVGLAHLLQGVEENAAELEMQGQQAARQLDAAAHGVEALGKESARAARGHRQVRKEQQMWRARGDRLWRALQDWWTRLRDEEAEQDAVRRRVERLVRRAHGLGPRPASTAQAQLQQHSIKAAMDKQARRLDALSAELSSQDAIMERRLQQLERLEPQVPAAVRPDSDCMRRRRRRR